MSLTAKKPDLNGKWIEVFEGGIQTDSYGRTELFDEKKLDYAVKTYNPKHHEAPLCIGHPEHNTPAYGWTEGLKRDGLKLLAKFKQVPEEISNAIYSGLWKKRSISFYPDGSVRHIGFLGAQPPAVKGLIDIKFKEKEEQYVTFSQSNNIAPVISKNPADTFSTLDNLNPPFAAPVGTSDSYTSEEKPEEIKDGSELWPGSEELGVSETPGEIRHKVRSPKMFDMLTQSKEHKDHPGVMMHLGKLPGDDSETLHGVTFDKNQGWTKDKAQQWMDDHKGKHPIHGNSSKFAEATHTEIKGNDIKKYCDTIKNTCENSKLSKEDISTIGTCCSTIIEYCDLMNSMGIAKCCKIIKSSTEAIHSLCSDDPNSLVIKSCCNAIDKSCDKLQGTDYCFNEIKPAKAEKDISPSKDFKEVKNMKKKKKEEEETPEEEATETPEEEATEEEETPGGKFKGKKKKTDDEVEVPEEEKAPGGKFSGAPKVKKEKLPKVAKVKAFSEYSEEELEQRLNFLEQKAEEEQRKREFAEAEMQKISEENRLQEYENFCDVELKGKLLPAHRSDVIDLLDICHKSGSYDFAEGGTKETPVEKFKNFCRDCIPEHKLFSEVATPKTANQQLSTPIRKSKRTRQIPKNIAANREQEVMQERTRNYMAVHPGVSVEQAFNAIQEGGIN